MNKVNLKTGITTGSCAAAGAKAGVIMLLSDEEIEAVKVKAKEVELIIDIERVIKHEDCVYTVVKKYAGDDPDVTDGIEIVTTVKKATEGIRVTGGFGVGVATKEGLKVSVGSSAINPVPMSMIIFEVRQIMKNYNYSGGVEIIISVPKGVEVSKKTLNSRLGIAGGISILGTTGIVNPMSEKALVDTIKLEIDVLIASGIETLIITPGNYGYDYAKNTLNIDVDNAVKCSNYIGETLDYALYKGIRKIIFIGHAGKLVKVAGGIMNTHSSIGDCRMEIIAAHCALFGMDAFNIKKIMECITIGSANTIMKECNIEKKVWESIGIKIGFYLDSRVRNEIEIDFYVFTQEEGLLVRRENER
ncbi:MAG: cobalt-precorrin-5B (C(1))-methyltransferase CbiD [Bacilli bacterium]